MDAITMTGVHKAFGRARVLQDVDLRVRPGTVHALLGPNGAGKTTAVSLLSTLLVPDRGTVTVAGWDAVAHPREVQRRIAVTGQDASVDELLTGRENLVMMGRLGGLGGRGSRARADELLERFDLGGAAGRRVSTWSGGMRRRLDLATTLVLPVPVVFLDEPTTGLDTRSRRELWDVVRELVAAGTTVLLTTQYLEEADRLADRISILSQGRVVAEGTAADLKARVGGQVVTVTDAGGAVVRELPTDGTRQGLRRALDELDSGGDPPGGDVRVGLRSPTLDDVFLAVTAPVPVEV